MALARQTRSGCTPNRSVGAARGDREPGLDLVEDEDHPVTGAELSDLLEITGLGNHDADVHHRRFHDDAGDFLSPLNEKLFQGLGVVEGHHLDVARRVLDQAAGDWRLGRALPPAHHIRVGHHGEHDGVMMSVIRPLDLADHIPAGGGTGDPDRVHRGLGARVGEPHHFEVEPAGDFLSEGNALFGGGGEVGAAAGRLTDRLDDAGMGMPHHHGAEAAMEVEVFLPVLVPDMASPAPGHVDRVRLHLLKRRDDPERQEADRPFVEAGRGLGPLEEPGHFLLADLAGPGEQLIAHPGLR